MSRYWTAAALGAANGLLALALTDGPRGAAAALRQALGPAGRRSLAACLALGIAMGCYTFWLFGALSRDFWQMLALTGCLLCASVTDCARREISVGACVCYAAVLLGTACAAGYWPLAVNALLGAACGVALLGIPHLLRPASVGRGDVLVLAVCGLGSGFPASSSCWPGAWRPWRRSAWCCSSARGPDGKRKCPWPRSCSSGP